MIVFYYKKHKEGIQFWTLSLCFVEIYIKKNVTFQQRIL